MASRISTTTDLSRSRRVRLLEQYVPDNNSLYLSIRNPSPKSDVARAILAYHYGGLYVDVHVALRRPNELRALLQDLGHSSDLLCVDRRLEFVIRPPEEHFFISSVFAVRRRHPIMLDIVKTQLRNLLYQYEVEQQALAKSLDQFVAYNIYDMTSAPLWTDAVLEPGHMHVRQAYRGRVRIVRQEDLPVECHQHRTYIFRTRTTLV